MKWDNGAEEEDSRGRDPSFSEAHTLRVRSSVRSMPCRIISTNSTGSIVRYGSASVDIGNYVRQTTFRLHYASEVSFVSLPWHLCVRTLTEGLDGPASHCHYHSSIQQILSQQKDTRVRRRKRMTRRYVTFTSSNSNYVKMLLQNPYAAADFTASSTVPGSTQVPVTLLTTSYSQSR